MKRDYSQNNHFVTANPIIISHRFPIRLIGIFAICAGVNPPNTLMLPQIAGMLRDISRESLVILYTPTFDRSFSVLMRQADHIIEIVPADNSVGTALHRSSHSHRYRETLPHAQRTLEVS